ncbi:general substrate transporter [Lipomyces chichibuensis]|uniref:general substrate transporter n=1 Tax=Lipomyces chichibuensis TaxID=1546026 RepID=UPI0033440ADB
MGRLVNVYTIALFASLGGLMFGFDISSVSGIIVTEQYINYYHNPLGTRQGGITSAMPGGSVVGALLAGILGDWLSRKVAIQIGAFVWCIGAAVQSASNGVGMLVVGRFISGACVGLTAALIPIYQSEIAPRKFRGRIVSFQQFAITWGILIQYSIQYGCSFLQSEVAFRLPWALQAIPGIILFLGLFWLPYSPRWLASKDRWDEALAVIAFLRTGENDINDPLVLAEYREIEDQIRMEYDCESNSFQELLSKKMRMRVFLSSALHICSQLTGANLLDYYILYIYESIRVDNFKLAAFVQYGIKVFMTVPAILWSDKWGRRPILVIGAFLMAICFFVVAGLYHEYGEVNLVSNQPYAWVIMGRPKATRAIQAFLYLAMGAFNVSWGSVVWMYSAEIVPLRIRAKTVSLGLMFRWAINGAVGFAIPPLFRVISWKIFIIFGLLNVGSSALVFFSAPETKQRTLEEIGEIFEHGRPVWTSFFQDPNRLDVMARDIQMEK